MNLHMSVPEWLYECRRHIEMAIAGTPTSELRNKMTEVNIKVHELISEVENLNRPQSNIVAAIEKSAVNELADLKAKLAATEKRVEELLTINKPEPVIEAPKELAAPATTPVADKADESANAS